MGLTRRLTLLGSIIAAIVPHLACNDDPVTPTVGGTYAATYGFLYLAPGLPPSVGRCSGNLAVTAQNGSNFSGSFTINPGDCSTADGSFTGTVETNGVVVISGLVDEWLADEAASGGGTCDLSGDTDLHGTFSANVISAASGVIAATCSGTDFEIEVELSATRS